MQTGRESSRLESYETELQEEGTAKKYDRQPDDGFYKN